MDKEKVLKDIKNYERGHIINLLRYIVGKNKDKVAKIIYAGLEEAMIYDLPIDKLGYEIIGDFTDIDDAKKFMKTLNFPRRSIEIGFNYNDDGSLKRILICKYHPEISDKVKSYFKSIEQ